MCCDSCKHVQATESELDMILNVAQIYRCAIAHVSNSRLIRVRSEIPFTATVTFGHVVVEVRSHCPLSVVLAQTLNHCLNRLQRSLQVVNVGRNNVQLLSAAHVRTVQQIFLYLGNDILVFLDNFQRQIYDEVKVALNQQGRVAGRPQATGRILQTFGDWFCELHVGSRVYRYDGVSALDKEEKNGC